MLGKEESQQRTINPWYERLEKQGLELTIPPRLKETPLVADLERDRLTGIAKESDEIRRTVAERLSASIREDRPFAFVHADEDNLKLGNDKYGRLFGDIVIIAGVARLGRIIENVQLGQQVEVIMVRPGDSADEVNLWFFGISSEELNRLRQELTAGENSMQTEEPPFSFPVTTAVIASSDESIKERIQTAKSFLEKNPGKTEYNFYAEIKERAETEVHLKKVEKDYTKLKEISPGMSIEEIIEWMCAQFGDRRISNGVLRRLLEIAAEKSKE